MGCSAKQDVQFRNSQISVMLEFLRAGVFNKEPVISDFNNIDWDGLMDMSVEHGVLAFVWDGICNLPQNQQPPRIQRINFSMSAQQIWDRYNKQVQALNDMIEKCNKNGMRLLLLKGIGLSKYYTKPSSRPCGDIDFYLFGDFEKGNKMFSSGHIKMSGKHAEFDFKGVHVENHFLLLNSETPYLNRIEHYLEQSLSNVRCTQEGYFVLNPDANMLYLLMHTLRHFIKSRSLPIRSLIDFGLFVRANQKELTVSVCHSVLDPFGLYKSFESLLIMVERILGLSFIDYLSGDIDRLTFNTMGQLVDSLSHKDTLSSDLPLQELLIRFRQLLRIGRILPSELSSFSRNITRHFFSILIKRLCGIPYNRPLGAIIKDAK